MISYEHLRNYSLFAGLAPDTLAFLHGRLLQQRWVSGDDIVAQGSHGDCVYFIQEGRVAVRVDGYLLCELSEGEQFGEMHVIDIQARSATVSALCDTTTLSLCNQDLLALRQHNMEAFIVLLMNCARDISRRLRESNRCRVLERQGAEIFIPHTAE